MSDLTSVIPQPEFVGLGDRTFPVLPFRLADLARLQAFAASRLPHPFPEDARRAVADPGTPRPVRRRILREAFLAAQDWPPRYGTPEADVAFLGEDGVLFFVAVALHSSGADVPPEELASIAPGITRGQLARLASVAFATRIVEELNELVADELGEPSDPDADGEPANWGKSFAEVAEQTGWTFAEIAELRLPQWRELRSGGESKVRARDGSSEALVRRCRFFDGELDDEPEVPLAHDD